MTVSYHGDGQVSTGINDHQIPVTVAVDVAAAVGNRSAGSVIGVHVGPRLPTPAIDLGRG
jgi:hypothetical protein